MPLVETTAAALVYGITACTVAFFTLWMMGSTNPEVRARVDKCFKECEKIRDPQRPDLSLTTMKDRHLNGSERIERSSFWSILHSKTACDARCSLLEPVAGELRSQSRVFAILEVMTIVAILILGLYVVLTLCSKKGLCYPVIRKLVSMCDLHISSRSSKHLKRKRLVEKVQRQTLNALSTRSFESLSTNTYQPEMYEMSSITPDIEAEETFSLEEPQYNSCCQENIQPRRYQRMSFRW